MARKQRINITLSRDVLSELEEEDNMSGKIESLLRDEYGL